MAGPCELDRMPPFGWYFSGQPTCFSLDGISIPPDLALRWPDVHPDKSLISEVDLNFSKTGFVAGRQALSTSVDDRRQVKAQPARTDPLHPRR